MEAGRVLENKNSSSNQGFFVSHAQEPEKVHAVDEVNVRSPSYQVVNIST